MWKINNTSAKLQISIKFTNELKNKHHESMQNSTNKNENMRLNLKYKR